MATTTISATTVSTTATPTSAGFPIAAGGASISALSQLPAAAGAVPLSAATNAATDDASSTRAALAEKETWPSFLGAACSGNFACSRNVQRHHERGFASIYKYDSK